MAPSSEKSPSSKSKHRPSGGDPTPSLSTPAANEAILEELESWIREGRVKPGQRLPSIKAIQGMLHVGQRGVHLAMESLERRGIIKTRNRSGNYLLPNAREILAAESTKNLQSAWVLDHYLPRTSKRSLTVFTIDCVGRMRGAWARVVAEFGESHGFEVNLLTPSEGRLDDLLESHSIDVVHTTPEMLQAIGGERFHEIPLNSWRDELAADLLPQVSAKMAARTSFIALPFAITVTYLFYNRTLAEGYQLPLEIPSDPVEFLQMMREAQSVLAPHGLDAFHVSGLADILRMSGALIVSIDGRVTLDRDQCLETLEILSGSGLPFPNPLMIPSTFASERLLAMRHPSFTSAELLERVSFDWQAFAVPLALGIRDASWLTMLAIPKSSQSLDAAEDMVSHLLSREMQNVFASVGGNLPVRRSALSKLVDADHNHVSNQALHRALSQSELSWPHMAIGYLADSGIHNAMRECVAGRIPPKKILHLVEELLKRHSRNSSQGKVLKKD